MTRTAPPFGCSSNTLAYCPAQVRLNLLLIANSWRYAVQRVRLGRV